MIKIKCNLRICKPIEIKVIITIKCILDINFESLDVKLFEQQLFLTINISNSQKLYLVQRNKNVCSRHLFNNY